MVANNEEENGTPILPEFLKEGIYREITNETEYYDYNLAKKEWKLPEKDKNLISF